MATAIEFGTMCQKQLQEGIPMVEAERCKSMRSTELKGIEIGRHNKKNNNDGVNLDDE